jgi:hypothetical protein
MRRLLSWYGASPLHLLTMVGCLTLGGYAAAKLLPSNFIGILIWLGGAVPEPGGSAPSVLVARAG